MSRLVALFLCLLVRPFARRHSGHHVRDLDLLTNFVARRMTEKSARIVSSCCFSLLLLSLPFAVFVAVVVVAVFVVVVLVAEFVGVIIVSVLVAIIVAAVLDAVAVVVVVAGHMTQKRA